LRSWMSELLVVSLFSRRLLSRLGVALRWTGIPSPLPTQTEFLSD